MLSVITEKLLAPYAFSERVKHDEMCEIAHLANYKDSWKDSFDSYDAVQVGQGSSGCVLLIDEDLVVKIFSEDEEGMLDFERERDIFQHLQCRGYSKYIVTYKEQFGDDGLVLEHLGTTLRQRLRKSSPQPQRADRYRWTKEACQALDFIHEAGVFHGDIGCHNFLMDKSSNDIKLCDFAGSKREDEDARVCYETRSQHPSYRRGNCTLATEIFALGSLIFEIIVGDPPLASQPDSEVRNRFKEKDFPLLQVEDRRMRNIIEKCWFGKYRKVSNIIEDIPDYI